VKLPRHARTVPIQQRFRYAAAVDVTHGRVRRALCMCRWRATTSFPRPFPMKCSSPHRGSGGAASSVVSRMRESQRSRPPETDAKGSNKQGKRRGKGSRRAPPAHAERAADTAVWTVNCSGITGNARGIGTVRAMFAEASRARYRDKLGLLRQADSGRSFSTSGGDEASGCRRCSCDAETGEGKPSAMMRPAGQTDVRLITATNRRLGGTHCIGRVSPGSITAKRDQDSHPPAACQARRRAVGS